jgi:hypothetical protein
MGTAMGAGRENPAEGGDNASEAVKGVKPAPLQRFGAKRNRARNP